MKNILLVEDNPETTKILQLQFNSSSYHLTCCSNGKDAITTLSKFHFHLLILDYQLPDTTGVEICKYIRNEGSSVPIIMLTSRAREADIVSALDAGVDDYVIKPFGGNELVARVNALLRRAGKPADERENSTRIVYKDITIDARKKKATLRGARLPLTNTEFDLLALLAGNPGKTFSRNELLDQVWGEMFEGYENTITTHINRLRNKLEADINNPEYILTSWGVGYRFSE